MKNIKNQKIKLMSILLVIIICLASKVYAIEITKQEYSDEYKEYLELTDEQKEKVLEPRKYNIETEKTYSQYLKTLNNKLRVTELLRGTTVSTYDLRQVIADNVKIRNQMQTNGCWTFATIGVLESNLAMNNYKNGKEVEIYDFSERHMMYASTREAFLNQKVNEKGFNMQISDGGNFYLAQAYLANGSGAISEKDMKFVNSEENIDISLIQNKNVITRLLDTVEFPIPTSSTKADVIAQMKGHITNYGGIYAGIHGAAIMSDYYNNVTGAIYCNSSVFANMNHAVMIIGWDDNYSKDNFKEGCRPENNGAWIIKNSWGENLTYSLSEFKQQIYDNNKSYCTSQGWNSAQDIPDEKVKEVIVNNGFGEEQISINKEQDTIICEIGKKGYMYVSYEDVFIYKSLFGIKNAKAEKDYTNIYQNDILGSSSGLRMSAGLNKPIYIANVFKRDVTKSEKITSISVYTTQGYTCKVYINPDGNNKNNLQEVTLAAGETETFEPGYHTIEFAEPVKLTGESFVVVLEITNDSYYKYVAIEQPIENTQWSNAVVNSGESFYSIDKNEWTDLATLEDESLRGNVTIKAFTKEVKELQSIKVTKAPNKVTYIEGENFNSEGMTVKATYSDSSEKEITNYSITNRNNLSKEQKNVTISYTENGITKTTVQSITVNQKQLTKIEITKAPNKVTYIEGEDFNSEGMIVKATYNNSSTKEITNYSVTNGNDLSKEQKSITISYTENGITKTVTQNITVSENKIVKITVTQKPNKTQYMKDKENLDLTGGILTLTYTNGATKKLSLDNKEVTVTGFNNSKVGKNVITIKYKELTTTFEIEIIENKVVETPKTLQTIKITKVPTKVTYIEGENFNSDGMIVKAIYSDSSEKEITNYNIINGSNLSKEQKNVTISYTENGITKTVIQNITVNVNKVVKIEVTQKLDKMQYKKDTEKLDLTGGILTLTYTNGTTKKLSLDNKEITVTGFNNSKVGKNIITVSYGEITTTFEIEIIENEVKEQEKFIDLKDSRAQIVSFEGKYISSNIEESYTIMNLKIQNIKVEELNSAYKYYYYVSGTQGDTNINEKYWLEISKDKFTKEKDGTYSVDVEVDSRKLPNKAEIVNSDNLYIYIKEVTEAGNNKISTIQIIATDNKDNNHNIDNIINGNENNNEKDNTVAGGKLPQTGIIQTGIIIAIVLLIAGFSYYRYKNIDK